MYVLRFLIDSATKFAKVISYIEIVNVKEIHILIALIVMSIKFVEIAGREFQVRGDPKDRYFRDYVPDQGRFGDAPIVVASWYLTADSVAVDVGANIGLSTLAFAHLAPSGKVIAFEPSPANFALLVANLEINRLTNVTPIMAAVSDSVGTVLLQEDLEFMAGSRVQDVAATTDVSPGIAVRATTLDLELSKYDLRRLDLLKIDVEGHERKVLDGAEQTLRRFKPMCVIEFNSYVMVYHQAVAPKEFLSYLGGLFPKIYHFDRSRYVLSDIRGREDEFLKINATTGFVDDLVCTFGELPVVRG